MQQMSCDACGKLIASNNLRTLVTQAANLAPPMSGTRRQLRVFFQGLYQQLLSSIFNTRTLEAKDIFDLQMLRARSLAVKCEIRKGHPTLGECSDLAFIEVDTGARRVGMTSRTSSQPLWQKSCLLCAAGTLGLSATHQIVLHPDVRSLLP